MGYHIELYCENETKDFIVIGESNNFIPYFWGLLYSKNDFELIKEEEYSILLKMDLEKLNYSKVSFSNEVLACWNDFIESIKEYKDSFSSLYLNIGNFLEMDNNYSDLLTENQLKELVKDTLKEVAVHNNYYELLGTSYFENLDENKYETLKPVVLKIQKKRTKTKLTKLVKLFSLFIISIIFVLYGSNELFDGHLVTGIISVFFLGLGGLSYFFNELDNSKK